MSTWSEIERTEPDVLVRDERTALDQRLDFQRQTLLWKCSGLTPEQLARVACPPSTLSLLGLVRHMSAVEPWFHEYDQQPDQVYFHGYAVDGPKNAAIDNVDPSRADEDLASYLVSVERSRAAVAGRDLDEISPTDGCTLRWIYLHMIEEYARHNGHADFLREAIDGATGE